MKEIKGESIWINAAFKDQMEINNNSHLCLSFVTRSLNDLLSFSTYLQDNKNKWNLILVKKNKYFKLSNWCFLTMSRRGRPNKTSQQIKEEQINFLLEDAEKNLEEYKKAID